jgi:hypothetical protein
MNNSAKAQQLSKEHDWFSLSVSIGEGILPAIQAMANGGEAQLEDCPSMYRTPPGLWAEVDEYSYHVVIRPRDGVGDAVLLNLGELSYVMTELAALYRSCLVRTSSEAFSSLSPSA